MIEETEAFTPLTGFRPTSDGAHGPADSAVDSDTKIMFDVLDDDIQYRPHPHTDSDKLGITAIPCPVAAKIYFQFWDFRLIPC